MGCALNTAAVLRSQKGSRALVSKQKPGPTSDAGKRIASQNAAKHHMTGRVMLVDGESQKDLDALLAAWFNDFPTDTIEAAKLVQEAANSEWILLRVQRQSDPIFVALFNKGMANWDDANHKQYQLTQRYLTAAERKLDRNRRNIPQYRRELRADARDQREFAKSSPAERSEPSDPPEKKSWLPELPAKFNGPFEQLAFITVKDGVTNTLLNPSNQQMRSNANFCFETAIVTRVITFECDQLPPEYAWCAPQLPDSPFPLRECRVQLVHTMHTLLTAIEREESAAGHIQQWPDLPGENICQPKCD